MFSKFHLQILDQPLQFSLLGKDKNQRYHFLMTRIKVRGIVGVDLVGISSVTFALQILTSAFPGSFGNFLCSEKKAIKNLTLA